MVISSVQRKGDRERERERKGDRERGREGDRERGREGDRVCVVHSLSGVHILLANKAVVYTPSQLFQHVSMCMSVCVCV